MVKTRRMALQEKAAPVLSPLSSEAISVQSASAGAANMEKVDVAHSIAPSRTGSDRSSVRLQKAEAKKKALDELASFKIRIMEETLMKKLEIDEQVIDEDFHEGGTIIDKNIDSTNTVATWLEAQCISQTPPAPPPPPEPGQDLTIKQNPVTSPPIVCSLQPVGVAASQPTDIEKLAGAITQSLQSVSHSRPLELPVFSGRVSEWLAFKAAYYTGAQRSAAENISRLRLCLKGDAREAVQALLVCNSDPEEIIPMLELRFGNENLIITDQLRSIYNLCPVNDSCDSLVTFASKVSNCVATMRTLNKSEHLHNIQLYSVIVSKLSDILRSKWYDVANSASNGELPLLVLLSQFLRLEAEKQMKFSSNYSVVQTPHVPVFSSARDRAVWTAEPSTTAPQRWYPASAPSSRPPPVTTAQRPLSAVPAPCQSAPPPPQPERYPVNTIAGTKSHVQCPLCESDHLLTKCPEFILKSLDDRWTFVKENRKCFRCLNFNHAGKTCKFSKYLHRLLQKPKQHISESAQVGHSIEMSSKDSVSKQRCALLKVVPIRVQGSLNAVDTYALLDEGATISLIDAELAAAIGTDGPSGMLHVNGVGSMNMHMQSKCVKLKLSTADAIHEINCRTVDKLNLSAQAINKEQLMSYKHISDLSDSIAWYENATPKLLIGQDNWPLIVSRELRTGTDDQPVLSKTLLGWIVHGTSNSIAPAQVFHVTHSSSDVDLDIMIKESFELDNIGITSKQRSNPTLDRATSILEATTKKVNGSWETGLLWCQDDIVLPDNSSSSLKRFLNLEQKLLSDPKLAAAYSAQMNKLFQSGYATLCTEVPVPGKFWTLPHFPVTNVNKPGKVRIVFDAAARFKGVSLNDNLLTGPDFLQSLLGVLWRFRQAPVAFVADIRDMYLRIRIREEDQQFQRFFWREPGDPTPPKQYKMESMVFGLACSPSSAIFTLNANAKESQEEYPEAAKAIQLKHYMDDYLDSSRTVEEAIKLVASVIEVHGRGRFDICSWASNSQELLDTIPKEKRTTGKISLTPDETTRERTLGMHWQPDEDMLSFNLCMSKVPSEIITGQVRPTKRQMLSVIMSVFDPMGLLSPLSVRGRILLQEAWRSKIEWDEKLEDKEYLKWTNFMQDLKTVESCKVPRCYSHRNEQPECTELHTFCDASEKAFAAACYFKMTYKDGEIVVSLVAAKARVTPLKPVSIPRLELQAALLGARLARTVIEEHEIEITEKFYWSDSITTLAWLKSDPRNYKAFVGHRLAAIDELTKVKQWRWVPTAENVADMATRDTAPVDLSPDSRWFKGPDFLKEPKNNWPREKAVVSPSKNAVCEEKVHAVMLQKKKRDLPDISRFSSWSRLIRATAYILLFVDKLLKRPRNTITVEHLNKAEEMWIKEVQEESFLRELSYLQKKEKIPKDSKLVQLTPILNDAGIMVVNSRIQETPEVPVNQKQPIILNSNHAYTKLLIHHYHALYNHGSNETVVNEIRQKYWITHLRSAVRSASFHCQHCKIKKAVPVAPPMGDLPVCRLDHHKRPFTHCGLDYFGPIEVAIGRRREKRYGALFTCMVTRAVHMELAGSLTSDSVIMALRRLIARRGTPTVMYSDNGTNFKGADAELKKAWKELNKDAIQEEATQRGMKWHYIPPTAAHMGGAWERLVQSIKRALKATLNERAPREEVLLTLLAEAELTVNSRPLTHVSVDHRDDEALTPNHFLIGSSSGRPIPGKFDDKDLMLRKQWKISQRLADMFWARWVKEYLPTLVHRTMPVSSNSQENVQVNDLVIICDSNLPRNMWPRGIVVKTFPGKDNTVRVADIKTSGGMLRRPVHKLIVLPVKDHGNTSSSSCNMVARIEVRRERARGEGCYK